MRQHVNLLNQLPDLRLSSKKLRKLILMGILFQAIFLLFLFYDKTQVTLLNHKNSELSKIVLSKQQQIAKLEALGITATDANDLASDISSTAGNVKTISRLNEILRFVSIKNTEGLSSYLDGIAESSEPGIWLDNIRFEQGGLSIFLEGMTSDPDLIDTFMSNLGQHKLFKKYEFVLQEVTTDPSNHRYDRFIITTKQ